MPAQKRKAPQGKGVAPNVKKPRQPAIAPGSAQLPTDGKANAKAAVRSGAKDGAARGGNDVTDSDDEFDESAPGCRSVDEFGRSVELLTVTITHRPLGIGFHAKPGPEYLAIHHFNPDMQTGQPYQAERSGVLRKGDQLVVVGDIEVQPLAWTNVVKLLTAGLLPMRLQFLRTTTHITSVRDSSQSGPGNGERSHWSATSHNWHSLFRTGSLVLAQLGLRGGLPPRPAGIAVVGGARCTQRRFWVRQVTPEDHEAGTWHAVRNNLAFRGAVHACVVAVIAFVFVKVKADLAAVQKAVFGPCNCSKAASIFKVREEGTPTEPLPALAAFRPHAQFASSSAGLACPVHR
jgi:hypothetical protein